LSVSLISAAPPSILSAYVSQITMPTPHNQDMIQKPNPIHIASPKFPSLFTTTLGSITPARTDPSLEKLKLTPKANASSLPLNQFEMIADLHTN